MHRLPRGVAAFLLSIAWFGPPVWAEVDRYYVRTTPQGEVRLIGVSVRRGGRLMTFDAERLIRARLVHFKSSDTASLITPPGSPPPSSRATLLGDLILNSGVINPGGADEPPVGDPVPAGPDATPGFAVEFAEPVVNLPGDDVVLFEFHRKLGSPPGGDAFFVGPLRAAAGLRWVRIERFDFDVDDPRAIPIGPFTLWRLAQPAQSLQELEHAPVSPAASPDDFKALAVGIDLSRLGYAEGAEVGGLFFQDLSGKGLMVDPVLVAGLPTPQSPNLLEKIPEELASGPHPGDLLEQMLAGPLRDVEEIVFAVRVMGFDHWYANFGYYSAPVPEYPPQRGVPNEQIPPLFGDGGQLCRLNLRTGKLTVLLDDPAGGVRDPQVHYNGHTILFSYRKGQEPYYHLYEIEADGTGLRQLTGGEFDDIEPSYLPDGGIMFVSSRCKRWVNCYRTPVAVLYRCDADGRNVRMISANIEHDNTPWPLPDGRVLYMRWEYVDRSQFCFHHLWTTNPDGTGQMVFFGNQFPGIAMLDAKPIPGTRRVVASFSPGHGRPGHMGEITVIDPAKGPDDRPSALRISPPGKLFRDPYPISDNCFLVADNQGIWVMDSSGATDLVYALPPEAKGLTCHEPRPLVPRAREAVVAGRMDPAKPTGRFYLSNIYHGRNMAGVKPGEIKKLLVLEQLPKPINFSGGMWPISAGGTFTLARVLGTVPVQSDGSAWFEAPAMRPLFFVALDDDHLSVKRMQSFCAVQPGETIGCVGCHETRTTSALAGPLPPTVVPQRPPAKIEPFAGVPDVLDLPRHVQPILDRHCTRCHNSQRPEGRVNLSGDHTPLFCESYWAIMHRGLVADGRNEPRGNLPPRAIGTSASRLLGYFQGDHYEALASPQEMLTLRLWIESSAVYAGTYAALGSGMHPVEFPAEIIEQRCGPCHGQPPPKNPIGRGMYFRFGSTGPHLPLVHTFTDLQKIRGSIGYYKFGNARPPQSLCNLSRPEMSLLLRAPLAEAAGGLAWCSKPVFADTSDPDYQAILARIEAAAALHQEEKRFDMPGFRPNVYYVRMMQRYGILPADLAPEEPIDVFATDEAYWRSFWYRPGHRAD